MHKEQKVVAGIHRLANPDAIDIESDLALIAVVGRGMKSTAALQAESSPHWHTKISMLR